LKNILQEKLKMILSIWLKLRESLKNGYQENL
jgi:hypothetical protein